MSKILKKQTLKIRICCLALCWLLIFGTLPRPAAAHNKVVHEGMTSRALSLMKFVARNRSINQVFGNPPEGVSAAEWQSFQDDIVKAFIELRKMAGVTLTSNSPFDEGTQILSEKLSFAASEPDYHIDDVPLFTKLSNAAGPRFERTKIYAEGMGQLQRLSMAGAGGQRQRHVFVLERMAEI